MDYSNMDYNDEPIQWTIQTWNIMSLFKHGPDSLRYSNIILFNFVGLLRFGLINLYKYRLISLNPDMFRPVAGAVEYDSISTEG